MTQPRGRVLGARGASDSPVLLAARNGLQRRGARGASPDPPGEPPPPPPPCVPGALALREARGTGPALRSWHCGAGFRVVQHVQVPVPALPATGQSLRAQCLGRAETGSGRACCSFPEFALRMPVEPLVITVFAVLVPGIWGVLWLSCVLVSLVLSVPFLFPPPL